MAYKDKDKQLKEEKAKLCKLKEDFKYNLKLLEERDQELERYDLIFTGMYANLSCHCVAVGYMVWRISIHLKILCT